MSIKTHNTESRFVIRPSNILLAGVYVCTFQIGNFTRLGNEGVKTAMKSLTRSRTTTFMKLILRHLVCTLQTGNFTRLGSEGVKTAMKSLTRGKTVAFMKLILCHLVGLGLLFSTKTAQDDKVYDR